jgi:hypothetical protein
MSPEAVQASPPAEAALSAPPAEWQVLRGCRVGGKPIPLVLMHPKHGVVLVGGPPDGPTLLRRRLEQARFPAVFNGHLPVIQLGSPDAPAAPALAAEPPLSMPGGDAWVAAVERALTRDPPAPPPERLGILARHRRNRGRLMLTAGAAALAFGGMALAIALLPPAPGPILVEAPQPASWEAAMETVMPLAAAPPEELPARPAPPPAPPAVPWPALAAAPLLPFAIPPLPPDVPAPPEPDATLAPRILAGPAFAAAPPPGGATAPVATPASSSPANAPTPRDRTHLAHAGVTAEAPAALARCRRILQRLQIGEVVPHGDFRFLQSGCPG